ncbi:MAG TPA: AAA family ATPase [Candidatus Binatia bacterium]
MNSQWLNLKSQSLLEHFGLSREPFNITPDPGFLYLSASHQQALARLMYGIDARKGFIVLTGEVGTGKTTLIHALLQELKQRNTQSTLIFNTISQSKDLLRDMCEDLGFTAFREDRQNIHTYLKLVNQLLLDSYHNGKNVTLILDEAQNLSPKVLESIRLLSNLETSECKLLQIIMAGQPELAVKLNMPSLRQLKQRVVLYHHLRPLNLTECSEYIARRIETAGGSPFIFTSKALEAIHACSGGIPRLINILCDNGLITAYSMGEKRVSAAIIRDVADDRSLVSASEEAARARGLSRIGERPVRPPRPVFQSGGDLQETPPARRPLDEEAVDEHVPLPPDGGPDRLAELIERLQRERETAIFAGDADHVEDEQPEAGAFKESAETFRDVDTAVATENLKPEVEETYRHEAAPAAETMPSFAVEAEPEVAQPPMPVETRQAESRANVLSPEFLNSMITSLTEAMGPMAPLVLRDQVSALGEEFDAFPKSRLGELVESTSCEILEDSLRRRFQQLMSQESFSEEK